VTLGGYAKSGATHSDFALARVSSNANSLDAGFGSAGKVITTIAANGIAAINTLCLHQGGEVFAAGSSAGTTQLSMARYRTDGSLDSAFGDSGKKTFDLGPAGEQIHAAYLHSNGDVYLAGEIELNSQTQMLVVRIR